MFVKIALISVVVLYSTWATSAIWVTRDKVYHIENEPFLSWHDANKHCEDLGMNLLSVETKKEFFDLTYYIKDKYNRIYPYWIGAYKDQEVFKWLAYNKIIEPSQMMWHANEPDNKSGNELCVHTWEGDFDWNDNDCELKLPFICELRIGCVAQWYKGN